MKVEINEQDLYLLLGSALRYALPRHSYITSVVAEMILEYKELLSTHMLENYLADIVREVQEVESDKLFVALDNELWRHLAQKLSEEIERRGN